MLKFIQAILIKVVFYLDFDYATIGKHIQQYRFELDKTQEEIAEKANISKNYLSKIETGKSAGRLDKYYSIAKALGVTIDMLIRLARRQNKFAAEWSQFQVLCKPSLWCRIEIH